MHSHRQWACSFAWLSLRKFLCTLESFVLMMVLEACQGCVPTVAGGQDIQGTQTQNLRSCRSELDWRLKAGAQSAVRRGTAAAQRSRMPPRHAGRGRGTTAQTRPLPEDRGMAAQTRPLQGDRGMTPRMHRRPDCNNKAAQMRHRQGGAGTTAQMPLHPGCAGMTAQMHPHPGGTDMTAPAPAPLAKHRSAPTAGLSVALDTKF